jgi:hypothetical protein
MMLGNQAELAGPGNRLGSAAHLKLAVDSLDLGPDGVDRYEELTSDFPG